MRNSADVLKFWFDEHGMADWFGGKPEFDAAIADTFADTHAALARGEGWTWRATPPGRLAEIIVLDQFSRQLFRGRPEAFASDGMALALAHRLRRLEAFRDVANRLMGRPQLNRDVFARGAPEPIDEVKQSEWTATLYDLLSAYATQRAKSVLSHVRFKKRTVWSLAEARAALERMIGMSTDWSRIDSFLISYVVEPALAATVMASSFASALELVREGHAEIHQKESFAPIYMRKRVGMNGSAATHDAQENT